MKNLEISRKDLCELLGITTNALKHSTKRGIEEEYLYNRGYKLLGKYKKGRETIYQLEVAKKTEWEGIVKRLKVHKTKFTLHTLTRHEYNKENRHIPIDKICIKTGASKKTSYKYDKLLVKEKFMNKEYLYIKHEKGVDPIESTMDDYNNYWAKHSIERDIRRGIVKDCEEGKITPKRMTKLLDNVTVKLFNKEGIIITKMPVYTPGEEGYAMYQKILQYLSLNANS